VTRDEPEIAGVRARRGNGRKSDAARADDRDPFAPGEARQSHAVGGHAERFHEAGILDAQPGGQGEERARAHGDGVGHAAVGSDAEHALRAGPTTVGGATEALIARAARHVRIDGDEGAVVEDAGELVPEGHRQGTEAQEVEIGPADARGADGDDLVHVRRRGVRDIDDLHAMLGVANTAHVSRPAVEVP
jgi:hypothetical protein